MKCFFEDDSGKTEICTINSLDVGKAEVGKKPMASPVGKVEISPILQLPEFFNHLWLLLEQNVFMTTLKYYVAFRVG